MTRVTVSDYLTSGSVSSYGGTSTVLNVKTLRRIQRLQSRARKNEWAAYVDDDCDWYGSWGSSVSATTNAVYAFSQMITASSTSPWIIVPTTNGVSSGSTVTSVTRFGVPKITPPKNHLGFAIRAINSDELFKSASPAEIVALQLLRKMVPNEEFRRYLKHGFISVRGPSGLTYQIRRNSTIVVRDGGERLASLCVHLHHSSNTPPTDHVVAKMLIVECDEPDIWKRSNVTWERGVDRRRKSLEVIQQAA